MKISRQIINSLIHTNLGLSYLFIKELITIKKYELQKELASVTKLYIVKKDKNDQGIILFNLYYSKYDSLNKIIIDEDETDFPFIKMHDCFKIIDINYRTKEGILYLFSMWLYGVENRFTIDLL